MIFEGFFALLSNIMLFSSYIENRNSFPHPLSPEKEKEYLELMRGGSQEAKDILIEHNLRLVVHIAKKYSNYYDNDELISIGGIGLIKAINTYEEKKGTQLATYASRCIENEILMLLRGSKKYKNNVSLTETIGIDKEGNEMSLMDTLCVDADSVVASVENSMVRDSLIALMEKTLSPREREIIYLRFGLSGEPPKTQKAVAKRYNISRSYVSRIENKALNKLRTVILARNIAFN